jgi:hypothetical protein
MRVLFNTTFSLALSRRRAMLRLETRSDQSLLELLVLGKVGNVKEIDEQGNTRSQTNLLCSVMVCSVEFP